jgi:hypothetical protein
MYGGKGEVVYNGVGLGVYTPNLKVSKIPDQWISTSQCDLLGR